MNMPKINFVRTAIVLMETAGVLAMLALAAAAVLVVRLQQGPLPLDALTARLEAGFAQSQNGFVFKISKTQLVWGGATDPFVLDMQDVRIRRSDGTPVAVINRARIALSKRSLLIGSVVPRELSLDGPALRVVRSLDGGFSLNVGRGGSLPTEAAVEKAWDETAERADALDPQAQQQLMADLIGRMRNPEWHGLLGGLERIVIQDAVLVYDDKVLGVVWRADSAQVVVARSRRGIVADAVFRGDFSGGVQPDGTRAQSSVMRLRASHVWAREETVVEAFFNDLNPHLIARQSAALSALSEANISLKGQLRLSLDSAMHPRLFSFVVAGGEGTVNGFDLYPQPLPVKGLIASGDYDLASGRGALRDLRVTFDGPQLSAAAEIVRVTGEETEQTGDGWQVTAQGSLFEMPMDDLGRYWPASLAPDAQRWVTTNLKKGIAHTATIDAALTRYDDGRVAVKQIGGDIDFTGITVDYFSPMRPVTGVDGKATYTADDFSIDVSKGKVGDIDLVSGTVNITDLAYSMAPDRHAQIAISAALDGPLKTALAVIDAEPLHYPSKLGLKLDGVEGRAKTSVTFSFPLINALTVEDVKVTATSDITDAVLPSVALGQDVRGGPFALSLDRGQLTVKGNGKFGAAAAKLSWLKNFSDPSQPAMVLTADMTVPGAMLPVFGVPDTLRTSGFLPATVALTEQSDGKATAVIKGDLTPLGFTIDQLNASKAEGAPGALNLELDMKDQKPVALRQVLIDSPDFTARGSVDFALSSGDPAIRRVGLSALRFGQSALSEVTASVAPGSAAYDVSIKGKQFDASAFFADDETSAETPPGNDAGTHKTAPFSLKMKVDHLLTGPDRGLDAVDLSLMRNDYARIERLDLAATAAGKPVSARYLPAPAGGKSLRFEAGDAGAALAALGITSSIRGGQIVVDAQPAIQSQNAAITARDMTGSVVLSDFSVRGAPALAKLVNALSLSGLRDLLDNKGLSFKKARARFSYVDRGQPGSAETQQTIVVKDGQTSGSSLGLMFEGSVDLARKVYDLNGTIVPVSDINTLLKKIPLLGDVLTAGGEGIFAATYTIKGPQKDPTVNVNPLSVLAPGVLRKIFFEG